MKIIYNFNELNIEKNTEDAIEIDKKRYKLIKVINFSDVDICESVLQKKGITDYYFIKVDNENIGIFVSYFQFNRVISFLEDERVPSTKMKLSEFTKKYEKYSMGYRKDTEDMKSQRLLNVNKQNMILQNFENISKAEVISGVIKKDFLIFIFILIGFFLVTLLKFGDVSIKIMILPLSFIPIIAILCLIEIFDSDKKKFKIENLEDKIILNDKKIIFHKDITRVYVDDYIYGWMGEKPENTHYKLGLGLGYGKYAKRRILVIEYNCGYSIKKEKFQLRYINEEKLEEFLELFRK